VEPREQDLREYVLPGGRIPFREWLHALRDVEARARVRVRLNRVRAGNFGDCKAVGEGVHELRLPFGPGYRVYFGRDGSIIVILLCGGTKRSQDRDMRTAKAYWQDYGRRKR
jgi:putative addiction module killer protein